MSRRSRAKLTERAFERLLVETDTTASEPDVGYRGVQTEVRENLKLSLHERRVLQDIHESRQRIATDRQLLRLLSEEVIAGNFVRLDDERERWRSFLVDEMRFPFADLLLERMYPAVRNSDYAADVLAAWERTREPETDGTG